MFTKNPFKKTSLSQEQYEQERVKALDSYGILDTPYEKFYDEITQLAADICEAPIAVIGLIDSKRQWFKSRFGIDNISELPREATFCTEAIKHDQMTIIEDAREHPVYKNHPSVSGNLGIVFYIGQPLVDEDGFALGTLCVIDFKPKKISQKQIQHLSVIASQILVNLKLHRELLIKKNNLTTIEKLSKQVPGVVGQFQLFPDGTYRFPFTSDAAKDVFEVNSADLKDDASVLFSRVHSEDLPKVIKHIFQSVTDLTDWSMDLRMYLPIKGLRWLRGLGRPEKLSDGSVLWNGFFTDVTEQKKMQEQIEEHNLKILQASKMASLGEMAGGIAHEINNPLSVILSRLRVIEHDLQKNENIDLNKLKVDLGKMKLTGERIVKIVRGLKAFSAGGENEKFQLCQLSQIVSDTIDLCREKFKDNGVYLDLQVHTDIMIHCRPTQISQVLLNLLNNSYDAITDKNEKWIKVEAAEITKYSDQEKQKHHVILSVTDSGGGIRSEIQSKLLNPFFTTKDPGKGTGLGLSISNMIIKAHQGLFYYDKESTETRFVIELPKIQE